MKAQNQPDFFIFMTRLLTLGIFTTFVIAFPTLTFAAEAPVFSDIPGTNARPAVEFLQENGVVEGFADGTFQPDKTITRAEFVKIVLESKEGVTDDCTPEKEFSDVIPTDWFYKYVCAAVNDSIIEGYADGTFRPHDEINFRDSAKITTKVHEVEVDETADGEWFVPFTTAITRERVLPGSVADSAQLLTRGEMAQMVWGISTGNEVENETLGELPQIENCAELEAQLRKYERRNQQGRNTYRGEFEMMVDEGMMMDMEEADGFTAGDVAAEAPMMESKAADDFSGTNLQESGVDEADIIKNDGSHIYLVKQNTIRILRAYPAEELAEEAVITIPGSEIHPQEIFLDGDTLTVIGNSYGNWDYYKEPMMEPGIPMGEEVMIPVEPDGGIGDGAGPPETTAATDEMILPRTWGGKQATAVIVYDITDRMNPEKIRSVTIEGNYLSSRRIGEMVYVATSKQNHIYGIPRPFKPEPFLPLMTDSAFPDVADAIGCADYRYVPNFSSPSSLVVTGIATRSTDQKAFREVMLGAGENVYASTKNMYVTRTDWSERYIERGTDSGWAYGEETEVYRFALEPESVEFTGKTAAEGRVLNQFSMSEYGDYFRIATQAGQAWGDSLSETMITIFDKNLQETGRIDGIAPGENMKSARFMGDRAFLITFKTVDPLFVVDLDPENPTILGKLKIPGWSDYLHPWDENHLIGFGKEVDESIDADKVHSDSAVYYTAVLGMKLAIFDVTDVSDPKEIHKEVIGYRGTTSEVLTNHKALLVDTEKGILGFPVTITENMNDEVGIDADIETTFAGARVYDVSIENGFDLRGAVTHYEDDEIFKKSGEYFYGDADLNIQRIIYIGENFYSISPNVIKALGSDDLVEVESLTLDKRQCADIRTENQCISREDCVAVYQTYEECRREFGEDIECEGEREFWYCEAE